MVARPLWKSSYMQSHLSLQRLVWLYPFSNCCNRCFPWYCMFIWATNQDGEHLIQARLDRYLVSNNWVNKYPNHVITHILWYASDHSPILLFFSKSQDSTMEHQANSRQLEFENIYGLHMRATRRLFSKAGMVPTVTI